MEKVKEREVFINRSQMILIAREFAIFVSRGTIHRWANEPDFPYPVGQNGRNILYSREEFLSFIKKRVTKIQNDH